MDGPGDARQAMIPAMVPEAGLQNAVVLNSGTLNIGPATGGLLVAAAGMGWAYIGQAALFLVAVGATLMMVEPPVPARKGKQESMGRSLLSGFSYVRRHELILALLLMSLIPMLFGQPTTSLVPVFAKEVLAGGAEQTGFLLAMAGIGSMASTVLLAVAPAVPLPGRVLKDNFRVVIPHECCANNPQLSHKVNLFDMHMKYADVCSTDRAIAYNAEVTGKVPALKQV